MSVEPVALGAMWFWNRMDRSSSGARPSARSGVALGRAGAAVTVLVLDFNGGEQAFEVVQRSISFGGRVEDLAQIVHGFGNGAHTFGHRGARGVGMASPLQSLGNFERFT